MAAVTAEEPLASLTAARPAATVATGLPGQAALERPLAPAEPAAKAQVAAVVVGREVQAALVAMTMIMAVAAAVVEPVAPGLAVTAELPAVAAAD